MANNGGGIAGFATLIGTVIAVLTFCTDIKQGADNSKTNIVIRETASQVNDTAKQLSEWLKNLDISLGVAMAHAEEASNEDYLQYLQSSTAQQDVNTLVTLTNQYSANKRQALDLLKKQLTIVRDDYNAKKQEMPTLPRERINVQGTLLSHRRQMGIIIATIRQSGASGDYLAFADDVERMLIAGAQG